VQAKLDAIARVLVAQNEADRRRAENELAATIRSEQEA